MAHGFVGQRTAARGYVRTHRREVVFAAVLVLYVALTLCIVFDSPLIHLDTDLASLHLRHRFPEWRRPILDYVMFGQRGPATLVFLPFFLWTAWRRRSTGPIVMLVTALILLNVSVGIVKELTGRVGPRAHHAGAHDLFAGGNIYPSGHVSNAVVLYGLIAMIVINRRRLIAGIAVFLSVTVGLGTIYLDTHWFSDVLGGWLAGALVLIALPWVMPAAQRWADSLEARLRAWWHRRRAEKQATGPTQAGASHTGRHGAGSRSGPLVGAHEAVPSRTPETLARVDAVGRHSSDSTI